MVPWMGEGSTATPLDRAPAATMMYNVLRLGELRPGCCWSGFMTLLCRQTVLILSVAWLSVGQGFALTVHATHEHRPADAHDHDDHHGPCSSEDTQDSHTDDESCPTCLVLTKHPAATMIEPPQLLWQREDVHDAYRLDCPFKPSHTFQPLAAPRAPPIG